MNKQELTALVAEILGDIRAEPAVKASDYHAAVPGPTQKETADPGEFVPDVTKLDLRRLYLTEDPENRERFADMKLKTPARLGCGKAGARYKTLTMLRFRADHAAAQDTVFSQVPEDFAKNHGMTEVQTKCSSKDEYLTRPDLGRCFDEENARKLREALPKKAGGGLLFQAAKFCLPLGIFHQIQLAQVQLRHIRHKITGVMLRCLLHRLRLGGVKARRLDCRLLPHSAQYFRHQGG